MSVRALLSQTYETDTGLKGRNFYVNGLGFGKVEERPISDIDLGNVRVEFLDVGHAALTGTSHNYEPGILENEERIAH